MLGTCILGTPELCRLLTQKCFPWQGLHRFGHGGDVYTGHPLIIRSHSSQILIGHWATEEWSCVVSHAPESTDGPHWFSCITLMTFLGSLGMVWDVSVDHMSCASLSINNHISWSHCHHTYKLTRFSYSIFLFEWDIELNCKTIPWTPINDHQVTGIRYDDFSTLPWQKSQESDLTTFPSTHKKITFRASDHQSWWSWHVPNLHLCRGQLDFQLHSTNNCTKKGNVSSWNIIFKGSSGKMIARPMSCPFCPFWGIECNSKTYLKQQCISYWHLFAWVNLEFISITIIRIDIYTCVHTHKSWTIHMELP